MGRAQRLALHGITPRALLLGALLAPALCAWTLYSEIVAQSTEISSLALSVAAMITLLALLVVNGALKHSAPRLAFSAQEMLFVFVMQATAVPVAGVGMIQFLNGSLANVLWYATPANGWASKYWPFLRSWAFPQRSALRGYFLGESTFFTAGAARAWLHPILVWSAFILILLGVMYCISSILRRRWVEQERLTFPIAALPLETTQPGGTPIFRNRIFWAGFLAASALEILAGIAYLYPSIPFFPIKPSDPRLDLSNPDMGMAWLFSTPPWSALKPIQLGFYPVAIGLVYLLPLDVSFSCWFFYMLRRLADVGATAMGFRDPGASLVMARIPYYSEQSGGAFLGLAIFSLWGMRHYLRDVARTAWRGRSGPLDDSDEPLSYRVALIGAAAGFLALVGFAMALGLAAQLAILFFVLWFLVIISYSRIRADAGLPWLFGPDMTPHQMIVSLTGTQTLSTENMVALTQFQWIDLDFRCTVMPNQIEAMKIATERKMNQRQMGAGIAVATVLGLAVSWIAVLAIYYRYGAASAHVDSYRSSMGTTPWNLLDSWVNGAWKPDWPRLEGVVAGFCVTGLLLAARSRFAWWPFHPVGYALSNTFTMPWLWFPTLLGWVARASILRWGGMKGHRQALPFFIGLILGDYVIGSFWALLSVMTGWQTYKVMPI